MKHKHYEVGERDIFAQGQVYADHVEAMTAESLHSKSDIAAELAHRDLLIQELSNNLRDAARFAPEPQKTIWLVMAGPRDVPQRGTE